MPNPSFERLQQHPSQQQPCKNKVRLSARGRRITWIWQRYGKGNGSTFLRSLQDISETMSPMFVQPRWQAIH